MDGEPLVLDKLEETDQLTQDTSGQGDDVPPKVQVWIEAWGLTRGRQRLPPEGGMRMGDLRRPVGGRKRSDAVVERPVPTEKVKLRLAIRDLKNFYDEAERDAPEDVTAPDPVQPKIDVLADLLEANGKAQTTEAAVFKDVEFPDVLAQLPEKTRDKKLEAIQAVFEAMGKRRVGLREAIAAVDDAGGPKTPAQEGIYTQARTTLLSTMDIHLPSAFQSMRPGELERRLPVLRLSATEKENKKNQLKQRFTCDERPAGPDGRGGRDAKTFAPGEIGKRFQELSDKYGVRSSDDPGDYFKRFALSPDNPTDMNAINEANDIVVDHCVQILDCGGTLQDVEELMKREGIPDMLWPPRLDQKVQAWRKVSREIQQQRLEELADKFDGSVPPTNKMKPPVEFAGGVKDFVSNYFSDIQTVLDKVAKSESDQKTLSDNLTKIGSLADSLGDIAQSLDLPMKLLSLGVEDAEVIELGGMAKLQQRIDTGMDLLTSTLSSLQGAIEAIDELGPGLGDKIMNELVPGLGLASKGVDLAKTFKGLYASGKAIKQNKDLNNSALERVGSGEDKDLSLVNALLNDSTGRKVQFGQGVFDATSKSMSLAGKAAKDFGGPHGAVAYTALAVVGGVVTVAGKVVIGSINWGLAKQARETLMQAQAGSPLAQQLVFKDCNFYAKMLLCLSAKEDNAVAQKYLVNQGIEECDLNSRTSMKILAETLMKSSGQLNQDEVPENWIDMMTGGVRQKIADKVTAVGETLRDKRKDREIAYDERWTYGGSILLTEDHYKAVKKEAVEKGLKDDSTGIGSALAKLEKASEAVAKIPRGKKFSPEMEPGSKYKSDIFAALDATAALVGLVGGSVAVTNPLDPRGAPAKDGKPKLHLGMNAYLGQLLEQARAKQDELNQLLADTGLRNRFFDVFDTKAPLDAAMWRENWKKGVTFAGLPSADSGVGKALDTFSQAQAALAKVQGEGPARRKAAIGVDEAADKLLQALDACQSDIGIVPSLKSYMASIRREAVALARQANASIGSEQWGAAPIDKQDIDAGSWSRLWKSGVDGGFADGRAGDGGVGTALQEIDKARTALGAPNLKPPKRLEAIKAYRKAVGRLVKATLDFDKAQSRKLKPFMLTLQNALERGQDEGATYSDELKGKKFKAVAGPTAAAWKASYGDAAAEGAVPPKDKTAALLAEHMEKHETAKKAIGTAMAAKKYKTALAFATIAEEKAKSAVESIEKLMLGGSEFGSNDQMSKLLSGYKKHFKEVCGTEQPLAEVLAGNAAPVDSLKLPRVYNIRDIPAAITSAADLGIIPAKNPGFNDYRESYAEVFDRYLNAKSNPRVEEKNREQFRKAALSMAAGMGKRLKALGALSKNKQWTTYIAGQLGNLDQLVKVQFGG